MAAMEAESDLVVEAVWLFDCEFCRDFPPRWDCEEVPGSRMGGSES